jgi:uncharacterized protein (AIM24 family)
MMTPSEAGGIELYRLTTSTTTTNNTSSSSDLLLTSGAYVASDVGVNIRTELQASNSMRNSLFSDTGLFLLRASGQGMVAFAAYGSIHKFELKSAGERRSGR